MIQVKINIKDFKRTKRGEYIKQLSYGIHWYYHTENEFAILHRIYGGAYMYVCNNKQDYEELMAELKADKEEWTEIEKRFDDN